MTTSSVQSMGAMPSVTSLARRQQSVELGVSLGHAGLHAARDHAVARLDAREGRLTDELGAPVAEVDEGERLDRDDIGEALELEGLDCEVVLAHDVEDAVEGVVLAALGVTMDVAI